MKNFKLLNIVLNLFDGGAAAAGDGGAGTGNGGTQGEAQALPGSTRRAKSGEYANVKYGKQPASDAQAPAPAAGEKSADVTVTSDAREEKRKAYQALIDGEYKEFYTEDTQRMINRRFKDTKNLQSTVDSQQPIMDMLFQRYKITDGDLGKLQAALDADDAYLETAAEEAGMSVEAYKAYQKMQRENAQFKAMQDRQRGEAQAQQQLNTWFKESESLKAEYPQFDLRAEIANPQFMSLLKAGIPVKHAYEVVHMDDIKAASAQAAAQAREKQVVEGIRSRGRRPAENGTSSQAAFTVKDDVTKLTKKDRADIARRVANGEKISF